MRKSELSLKLILAVEGREKTDLNKTMHSIGDLIDWMYLLVFEGHVNFIA